MEPKEIGELKFFAPNKDYGFIISDSVDRDIFFYWGDVVRIDACDVRSDCDVENLKRSLEGHVKAKASFDLAEAEKGFVATNIEFDIEYSDMLRGIRVWEMFDADDVEVNFTKKDEWKRVDSINLSRNLRLVFMVDEFGSVIAKVVDKPQESE